MRRRMVPLVALLLVGCPASTASASGGSGGAAAPDASGGATYGARAPVARLYARSFSVTPGIVRPGSALRVAWQVNGPGRRARITVDLLSRGSARPAATLRLGRRPLNRPLTARWKPRLGPGTYTVRLRATRAPSHHRARVAFSSATVQVTAPPVQAAPPAPAPAPVRRGVFPVAGTYSLGGRDARFGATRTGHNHQGHDITAAEGTPVVAPRAGFVYWRAYQAKGAGYYLVLRCDDGRDYVFMHLEDGSLAVVKDQAVRAGQRIAAVGSTGASGGPHLHFEIWPDGWWAKDSQPIDPLPDLLAWAT